MNCLLNSILNWSPIGPGVDWPLLARCEAIRLAPIGSSGPHPEPPWVVLPSVFQLPLLHLGKTKLSNESHKHLLRSNNVQQIWNPMANYNIILGIRNISKKVYTHSILDLFTGCRSLPRPPRCILDRFGWIPNTSEQIKKYKNTDVETV